MPARLNTRAIIEMAKALMAVVRPARFCVVLIPQRVQKERMRPRVAPEQESARTTLSIW